MVATIRGGVEGSAVVEQIPEFQGVYVVKLGVHVWKLGVQKLVPFIIYLFVLF